MTPKEPKLKPCPWKYPIAHNDRPWFESLGSSAGATITSCGRYRMMLWRTIRGDAEPLVFVMLNPSTADEAVDDPTIRRCMGFARREKMGGIVVVNLSPWRATDPKDLEKARRGGEDVLLAGENRKAMELAKSLGEFVLAWGGGVRSWMDNSARVARHIGHPARCLGKTKKGEPRHPLMVLADAKLELFP